MINRAVIQGRLGKDPELRTTQSGLSVTTISVAVDVGYGDKKETYWIEVQAWRKTAEFICNYFSTGEQILEDGKLAARKYTDKNGYTKIVTYIVADNVSFCGSKNQKADISNSFTDYDVSADEDLPF